MHFLKHILGREILFRLLNKTVCQKIALCTDTPVNNSANFLFTKWFLSHVGFVIIEISKLTSNVIVAICCVEY